MSALLLAYQFGWLLAAACLVLWIFIWLLVAVRVVRRHDIGIGGKILWIVAILVLTIVYRLVLAGIGALG